MKLTRAKKLALISAVLLVVDQVVKILVKTNMHLGEHFNVLGKWFQIYFIENKGMAFGMQFGGDIGKIILSSFRVVLVVVIFVYLRSLLKKKAPWGVLVGILLIMTGALGNIIDCMFYGLIFDSSTFMHTSSIFPAAGGYAPFFLGKVVDMLYFPLIDSNWPQWVPFIGGQHFIFFRPIFNIADSCITVGALYLILFQRKYFSKTMD